MRARYRGGFSGFTLIELLVVIAIIGLLLPAGSCAGRPRTGARGGVSGICANGVIFSLYLEDHDNRFMPGSTRLADGAVLVDLHADALLRHAGIRLCRSALTEARAAGRRISRGT